MKTLTSAPRKLETCEYLFGSASVEYPGLSATEELSLTVSGYYDKLTQAAAWQHQQDAGGQGGQC